MRKNNLLIVVLVIFILAIAGFIINDFFSKENDQKNVYEYNLDEFQNKDPDMVSYSETVTIDIGLDKLKGIGTDIDNNIFITGQDHILKYNSEGQLLLDIETATKAGPIEIYDGKIYHGARDHIRIYDNTGELLDIWEPENENSIITSIALLDTNIYVADAVAKLVYHYSQNGILINQIGDKEKSPDKKGFIIPSPYFDVKIGREDEVWIVNPGRHRLESYSKNGEFKYSWNKTSMGLDGFSGCCNPTHIALLEDGSFVTSEKGLIRVKIHEPNGDFRTLIADQSYFDKGTTGLDIAIDNNERILILDPTRGQVRVFETK